MVYTSTVTKFAILGAFVTFSIFLRKSVQAFTFNLHFCTLTFGKVSIIFRDDIYIEKPKQETIGRGGGK